MALDTPHPHDPQLGGLLSIGVPWLTDEQIEHFMSQDWKTFDQSREWWRSLTPNKSKPENSSLVIGTAEDYLAQGKYRQQAQLIELYIQTYPDRPTTTGKRHIGQLYACQGEYEKAIPYFRRIRDNDPSYMWFEYARCTLMFLEGNKEQFESARKRTPTTALNYPSIEKLKKGFDEGKSYLDAF